MRIMACLRKKGVMKLSLVILALSLFGSCTSDGIRTEGERIDVIGSWQLFERGYSPGDRYIVEEVPAEPGQFIHFNSDSSFTSDIDGYQAFNRFRVRVEEQQAMELILFSDVRPAAGDIRSFTMLLTDQRLELRARGCIEGCHEAYRPVASDDQNP